MKYIRQFVIILFISFIGEALKYVLPLPIPASIYGLVLMFIPAGVGLLNAWDTLKPVLIPIIVILFASTIVVMGVSGKVTQTMIEAEERKKNEGHSE